MKKYQALMIPLGVVLLSFAGGLQAKKILLWNTLDSEEAVMNSEIGPNGTIVGTAFAFEAGQFGNGYIRFSYANSLENLMEAVDRMRRHLSK